MKAARIVRLNEPLQIQELQTPTAKGPQVLIKIQSTGVCHSDVHVWEGYYEGIEGQPIKTTDRGVRYPVTPGHEIAGIVDGLGEQAEGFSKNEKVVVYPYSVQLQHILEDPDQNLLYRRPRTGILLLYLASHTFNQ